MDDKGKRGREERSEHKLKKKTMIKGRRRRRRKKEGKRESQIEGKREE